MRWLALPLLVLALSRPAGAQSSCLGHIKFPAQGRWAEYKATFKTEPHTVRYGVIGQESRAGKALQWVEMRMEGKDRSHNLVYQMLVPGSLLELGQVQEIVFKPGDHPAMKMSGEMVNMIRGQLQKQSIYGEMCKGVTLVGKETITVPAGAFEALHFRSDERGSDSWISPAVAFSLVRSTGKDYQVELVNQGTGATSSIKEKPQEMKGMGRPSHYGR
jgi:hypothetical protein